MTDDLELAIDRLLGFPSHAPDGSEIPPRSRDIKEGIEGTLLPLTSLPVGLSSTIELVIVDGVDSKTLQDSGIEVNVQIIKLDEGFSIGGIQMSISNALQSRILVRTG